LTENLRALENDGLVKRTVYAEVPPHVEYSLTEMGYSLQPLFNSMIDWGNSYKSFVNKQE
jgi:DNA-binding HxlR family transcriptional regulator